MRLLLSLWVSILIGYTSASYFSNRNRFQSDIKNIDHLYITPVKEFNKDHDFESRLISMREEMFRKIQPKSQVKDSKQDIKKDPKVEEKTIEIYDDEWDKLESAMNLEQFEYLLGIDPMEEEVDERGILIEKNPLYSMSSRDDIFSRVRPKAKNSNQNSDYWIKPEKATCQPEERTLDLKLPRSIDIIYFPTCVRAKQCGGCCPTESQSCQPVAIKDVTVKVIKVSKIGASRNRRSDGPSRRRGRGRRTSSAHINSMNKTIEVHTACKCLCKKKESDCDLTVQIYNDRKCTCDCINSDDHKKCLNDPAKMWNDSTCLCQCREAHKCSTGYEFDHNLCKCVPMKADIIEAGALRRNFFT